ncbi:hypothetical protein BDZ89DRAFT_1065220 [Hymenopellis radicata]|nr:hypothetical protein BDZ89DRAFT_1065220 [Hymenopellis radicata]
MALLYVGWKIVKKTKLVSLTEMDVYVVSRLCLYPSTDCYLQDITLRRGLCRSQ